MRGRLGVHLATYRQAVGVSQPVLAGKLGRTRSAVSKVENGQRGMPEALWIIADQVCCAEGALIAEYTTLVQAERDYREQHRTQSRHDRQAAAQDHIQALRAWPAPGLPLASDVMLINGQLAEELVDMITSLARSLGRRDALHMISLTLAAIGLSDLDPDEHTRLARTVACPSRIDAQVINNLAITLASCKRAEDKLGPRQILDTVIAQHQVVHRLLEDCPSTLRKPLYQLDSTIACTIGWYLVEMGYHDTGSRYLGHARQAGHHANNPACAAYAACHISQLAFLQQRDIPAALDSAAAARALAARTNDPQIQAWAEQQATAAYALDNQYGPCMAACDRARQHLTNGGSNSDSPAYWVNHGVLDSNHSSLLSLLGKPQQALNAALTATRVFDHTYVRMYGFCQVRLAHALTLSKEITEAARILLSRF
jgi:transcriptional regulator with XRE-family HTH domain